MPPAHLPAGRHGVESIGAGDTHRWKARRRRLRAADLRAQFLIIIIIHHPARMLALRA
jgi:hypothetical protein